MILVEDLEYMVTKLCMLQLSLHDSLLTNVFMRGPNHRLHGNLLDLAILWLVLADLRWIGLTCMTILPSIASCSVETCRFLVLRHIIVTIAATFLPKALLEGYEEAGSRTRGATLGLVW